MRRVALPSEMTIAAPSRRMVASSLILLSRRMSARSRRPDSSAALPVMNVWREADVLPQSGVRAVSGPTSSKSASGMPSASAQICVITVFEPWPMSVAP